MSEDPKEKKGGGRKKLLLLLAVPLVLGGAGAGLWFGGLLPGSKGHAQEAGATAPAAPRVPVFLDMPDIVANLNVPGRRSSFIKLRSKLELARTEDLAPFQAAMPRLLDLFQTYLREMRPEELRGSQGTYRLREELRVRAGVAASPAKVLDVLFVEMIVQ